MKVLSKLTGLARPSMSTGSSLSAPYWNCTIPDEEFLTVSSYWVDKSSRDFINRLDIYPVSAVFTAVSTRPSRPDMAWKRNSVGVKPEKKLLRTNPFEGG